MVKTQFWHGDGGSRTEGRDTCVCGIVKDGGWNGCLISMLGSFDHIPNGENQGTLVGSIGIDLKHFGFDGTGFENKKECCICSSIFQDNEKSITCYVLGNFILTDLDELYKLRQVWYIFVIVGSVWVASELKWLNGDCEHFEVFLPGHSHLYLSLKHRRVPPRNMPSITQWGIISMWEAANYDANEMAKKGSSIEDRIVEWSDADLLEELNSFAELNSNLASDV
ncbi:hypothetical protein A2U01_0003515 [Trifolium medium]|uniref:Uncharacterized protein n=1 Tax=Trifolium medium TaxID=97028 RepID=A0A392M937_9FABA|nr:hypothetical protein [Trifolium medium]